MENDAVYFARRAEEERIAADRAGHPKARRAHLELAELYAGIAALTESGGRRTGVQIIRLVQPPASAR